MAQTINTNVASLTAQRNLNKSQSSLATAMQRLSSGLRINSAKDDAAGLAISERMTSQIRGLNQAVRNANDGISLSQTAEGALNESANSLQRIRELAVQSANSTNSASDRAALNSEVQALLSEIQRTAETTQFNGQNVIDGSFQSSQFQVGANANQTIAISVDGATTSTLGTYQATSTAVSDSAFDGAGFTINGIEVGVSAETSAAGVTNSSAGAKATAINAVSNQTGVTASASTTVTGGTPTARSALDSGDLLVNGIAVGAVAADTNAVTQARSMADAINDITAQTGVVATADTSTGQLTLTSSEGRDITLSASGADATARQANIQQIQNATGLDVSDGVAATVNEEVTLAFVAANEGTGTGITAGDGTAIGDTIALGGQTFQFVENASFAAAGNVAVVIGDGETAASSIDKLEAAINAEYDAGRSSIVTSGNTDTGLVLTSDKLGRFTIVGDDGAVAEVDTNDGAITTSVTTPAVAADDDADGVTTRGTLTLSAAENFTLGGADLAFAGMTSANAGLTKLSTVDISTLSGANDALSILDGALSQITSSRAELGALQSRFESAISNLSVTSENLSAARSRIRDADFAAETAEMTRSQILQQAGVAMVSQANALPQSVLSLLQ